MDEPRYIESYSVEELEKELARKKLAAVTLRKRKVILRASDGSKVEGEISLYEDKSYPTFIVWRNSLYKTRNEVSFSGAYYDQIEAMVATVEAEELT
jgi:hypothetical protein